MNLTVRLPDGRLQDFAPAEARKAAAYLGASLPHVDEAEQAGTLRAIHDLELAATPEAYFDVDRFTPSWYEPGWVANP